MLLRVFCCLVLCISSFVYASDNHTLFFAAATQGLRDARISQHLESQWNIALYSLHTRQRTDSREVLLEQLEKADLDFDRYPHAYEKVLNHVRPSTKLGITFSVKQLIRLLDLLGDRNERITRALEPFVEASLAHMTDHEFEADFIALTNHRAIPSLTSSYIKGLGRARSGSFQVKLATLEKYLTTPYALDTIEALAWLAYQHPTPTHQADQVFSILAYHFDQANDPITQAAITKSISLIQANPRVSDFLFKVASKSRYPSPLRTQARTSLIARLEKSQRHKVHAQLMALHCLSFFPRIKF